MIIRKILRNGLPVKRIVRGGVILWEPVSELPKLETPVIHLETTSGGNTGERTPAILGVAVLGRTILGDYSSGLPKLEAPLIKLETVGEEIRKLGTPEIYLCEEGQEEPDVPKLATPTIKLDTVHELVKLDTPFIRLENVEEPDEPNEPVSKKLDAPAIHLETAGSDESGETTPAILGVAVLGRTILGAYGVDVPKLTAPVIRLETVGEDLRKLDAPEIYLHTDTPGIPKLHTPVIRLESVAEPEEPDEPVIQKLNAPVIYLHVDEPDIPDVPVIEKLGTPTIYLEVIEEEEPDVPVVQKLDAPAIRLETVTEPEEPEIIKLATPEIYLEEVKIPKLETPVIVLEESIIPEQTFTFTKSANNDYYQCHANYGTTNAIEEAWTDHIAGKYGEAFGVEWDGTAYEVTAFDPYAGTSSAGGCTCLGNVNITDKTLANTGEPFVLLNALWAIYFRTNDTSETHTIRVYKI